MSSLKCRIELTNQCANTCWYCYTQKGSLSMARELYVSIIERLRAVYDAGQYNRFKIGFSGGDPFRDDFIVEAHHIAREIFKGISTPTYSTISRYSDLAVVERYFKVGGGAYYSLNEDPIDEVDEKLSHLRAHGFKPGVFVLLTRMNLERLDAIIDLIVKHDMPFRLNHLMDLDNELGQAALIKGIDHFFDYWAKQGYPVKLFGCNAVFGAMHLLNLTSQYCGYGKNYYHFNVKGEVSRCQCEPAVASVDSPDIQAAIQHRVDVSDCLECEAFYLCRGGCIHANRKRQYCEVYKRVCHHVKKYHSKALKALTYGGACQ